MARALAPTVDHVRTLPKTPLLNRGSGGLAGPWWHGCPVPSEHGVGPRWVPTMKQRAFESAAAPSTPPRARRAVDDGRDDRVESA